MQQQGALALLLAEPAVAAGQREPVGLPHGRDGDDLHGDVEVEDHPADRRELLGVLLPEQREVRSGQVQQLEHDGADPIEVARATGALEDLAEGPGADPDEGCGRVDDVGVRGEHHVRSLPLEQREVGGQGPGIAVEVLTGPELQRVDEDRCDDAVGLLAGRADQLRVPLVQGAHRHDDRDPAGQGLAGRLELLAGAGHDQVGTPGAGHRATRSASTPSSASAWPAGRRPLDRARSAVSRARAR